MEKLMAVTLEEAKAYLKVEYEEEDALLSTLIGSAEKLCEDILRTTLPTEDDVVRAAILYAVGVLYENPAEMDSLVDTLKGILSGRRQEMF